MKGMRAIRGVATKAVKGHIDDSERLAAYDAFARGIRAELAEVGARMDVLRTENKVKTATYRQLFAARMNLKDIDRRLVERGL